MQERLQPTMPVARARGIIVPPARERHRLSTVFRIHTSNIKTPEAMEFLPALDRHVQRPLIVVQDNLNVHKAAVRRWLAGRPPDAPRVMIEWLSSYAPELNPAEQLWNNGKRVDLANVAPADRADLAGRVRRSLIHQRLLPEPDRVRPRSRRTSSVTNHVYISAEVNKRLRHPVTGSRILCFQ